MLPKIIWTYWHQGIEESSCVVKKCIEQFKRLHPEWDIHVLNKDTIGSFIEPIPMDLHIWKKLSLPHRSDLIRTQLLIKYGGVWLDPTVFCIQPLDQWLFSEMDASLFLFHRPGNDRIVSNWFIAAFPDNYLLNKLYERLIDYWNENKFRNLNQPNHSLEYLLNRAINGRSLRLSQLWLTPIFTKVLRVYPYMIYHFMFYYLIEKDSKCRFIYDKMPKISSDGPHSLQRFGLSKNIDDNAHALIQNSQPPLFKLKWKIKEEEIPSDSVLAYLIKIG